MRPGANRRDHVNEARRECAGSPMSTRGTSFNEARREAPGSPLSKVCFRVNPDMRFNEARREAPGSRRIVNSHVLHRRFNEARREAPGSRESTITAKEVQLQ